MVYSEGDQSTSSTVTEARRESQETGSSRQRPGQEGFSLLGNHRRRRRLGHYPPAHTTPPTQILNIWTTSQHHPAGLGSHSFGGKPWGRKEKRCFQMLELRLWGSLGSFPHSYCWNQGRGEGERCGAPVCLSRGPVCCALLTDPRLAPVHHYSPPRLSPCYNLPAHISVNGIYQVYRVAGKNWYSCSFCC